MPSDQVVLWRWAKPSKTFKPKENPRWGKNFRSHNKVVYAGFNPIDWMWLKNEREVLHKIVLNKQQAEYCVVAEGHFRPTNKEIEEFIEKKGIPLIGSQRRFSEENYEKSFVSLLEYSGGYNLSEVLIPFSVKAEVVRLSKMLILFLEMKNWISKKIKLKSSYDST